MRPLLGELVPRSERAAATEVDVHFALTSTLKRQTEAGAAFDLVLLPRPQLDVAVGLCVRAGAVKPDIAPPIAGRTAERDRLRPRTFGARRQRRCSAGIDRLPEERGSGAHHARPGFAAELNQLLARGRCACAIALSATYCLDFAALGRYIRPTLRQAVSFARRNGRLGVPFKQLKVSGFLGLSDAARGLDTSELKRCF